MIRKILLFFSLIFILSCNSTQVEYDKDSIKVGTFNLEWFGDGIDDRNQRSDYDIKMIADLIMESGADIIGLQEIENVAAMDRLIKHMPGFKYIIGETGYVQNPAVIYRDSLTVKFIENYQPLAVKPNRTRAGLVVEVKKGNFDFVMMVVHFKSTSRFDSTQQMRQESFELRRQQAIVVKNWADSITTKTKEKDVIIVGDFNDNPKRDTKVLLPLIQSNELMFLSDNLGSCKNPNWDCIDHIVINRSVFQRLIPGSVYMYDVPAKYEDYEVDKISDHCPVYTKFNIMLPDND